MKLQCQQRQALFHQAEDSVFDITVIGGGIHGAAVARDAALRQYRVLLLEAQDYASATSSRSSKMLHGGIRYLETADFGLVRESLLEREILYQSAPHLVRPEEFYFPVIPGRTRPAWQLRVGLRLYDALAHVTLKANRKRDQRSPLPSPFPCHSLIQAQHDNAKWLRAQGLQFSDLFSYFDGQMNDARITIENILDAQLLGATTLNYAALEHGCFVHRENLWRLTWRCSLTGETHQSKARYVVNATGPWAKELEQQLEQHHRFHSPSSLQLAFSHGVHLLFEVPWPSTFGLILPTPNPGQYYFVWPVFLPGGSFTMVGTTEREVSAVEQDPQATQEEVRGLLELLQRDLPHSGLSSKTLYQTFCGTRSLVVRDKRTKRISSVSRSHVIIENFATLTLLGGKFTSARATAQQIVDRIDRFFLRGGSKKFDTRARPLPGGGFTTEKTMETLTKKLTLTLNQHTPNDKANDKANGKAKELAANTIACFGSRSELLIFDLKENKEETIDKTVERAQIRLSIKEEQALTIEDVLRRRLGYSLQPGYGLSLLPIIIQELAAHTGRSMRELELEAEAYQTRWCGNRSYQ